MKPRSARSRLAPFVPIVLAAIMAAGCFNPFDPQVSGFGTTEPPPYPDSPQNALRFLEWCYEQRAIAEYRELFSDDYRFVFGQLDPDGNAYRDNPWTREDELESTTKLFQGGDANQPAATSITIILDRSFVVRPDPRYPSSTRWRKLIRTQVSLRVVDASGSQTEVSGFANFFLVRGDSALIPNDLKERGFGQDSTRWYISRHEDDTPPQTGPSTARAARTSRLVESSPTGVDRTLAGSSWGRLKARYR